MSYQLSARTFVRAALIAAATFTMMPLAVAAPQDYRFELVGAPQAEGGQDIVQVRLVHVPDNKPVAGAFVFQSEAMMGEGAGAMKASAKTLPSDKPDVLRLGISGSMAGPWTLVLAARVQGESGVVHGTVPVVLGR